MSSNRTVYISYTTADAGICEEVARALRESGYVVWWDHHSLSGGRPLWEVAPRYIRKADIVLVLFDRASLRDPLVQRELAWTQRCIAANAGEPGLPELLVPVVTKGCILRDDLLLEAAATVVLQGRMGAGMADLLEALPPPVAPEIESSDETRTVVLSELSGSDPDALGTIAALGDARAAREAGEIDAAHGHYRRALALAEEVDDRIGRLGALLGLGDLALAQPGGLGEARSRFTQARDLAELMDLPVWRATALRQLGRVDALAGRLEFALSSFETAAALAGQLGRGWDLAAAIHGAATVHADRDDHDTALVEFRDAADRFGALRDYASRAHTLENIGLLHDQRDEVEDALAAYEEAFELFDRLQHDLGRARTLLAIGTVRAGVGSPDDALNAFTQAIGCAERGGDRLTAGHAGFNAAQLLAQAGDSAEALTVARRAHENLTAVEAVEEADAAKDLVARLRRLQQ
jgi:tetratricopeptide (TPR) repeat protein